ncbi:MAG: hypothetical protein JSU68_03780 [Phycisphaerales bacterium]|nr:MAG: hypothetical protein JSU68_03780 [Phycisphaerales bacterium]
MSGRRKGLFAVVVALMLLPLMGQMGACGADEGALRAIVGSEADKEAGGPKHPVFWSLIGNVQTVPGAHFLGTTDNQALELRVNNTLALRLEHDGRLAAGRHAKALHDGSFVSADSTAGDFESTAVDQFLIRASNGVGIGTDSPTHQLTVAGDARIDGPVGIGMDPSPGNALSVNGNLDVSGKLQVSDEFVIAGDGSFGGDLNVAGTTTTGILTVTGGSDIAEPFVSETRCGTTPAPGMAMVIDPEHPGQLKLATQPYDRKVAGVISGANGLAPGLMLKSVNNEYTDGNYPVALTGRVWCWCDAEANGPVQPGDLLTTSGTPGHAMKVTDFGQAQGAILGKAMTSLDHGQGLLLLLVALQ